MSLISRIIFGLVNRAARRGLADPAGKGKERARATGIRGETFAYWYLRRHGYVFVARNFTVPGMKGEIDLIGYDGPTLCFVEVKTRSVSAAEVAKPEEAITPEKRRILVRMARIFLSERRIPEAQCRFDVLAIESRAGAVPIVRLHKAAF
jgi:putative endonuclease